MLVFVHRPLNLLQDSFFIHYSFLDNAGYTSNSTELSASAPLLVKGPHKVHGAQLLVCNDRTIIVLQLAIESLQGL